MCLGRTSWKCRNGRACFPFFVPVYEEVDANLEFVFDFRDFILGDWLFDLVETLFGEQVVVPERTLGIFG